MIDKIDIMTEATGMAREEAEMLLEALEAHGYTIYKKKVLRTGKRPIRSQPMTAFLRQEIVDYYKGNPEATQSEVAAYFNVNAGRVAEALAWSIENL